MTTKSSNTSTQYFQSFNQFSVNEDLQDPGVNFYQKQTSSLDKRYYIPNEYKKNLENVKQKSFFVLLLNICSMIKNHFEN